ncbi:MAG: ABC transporter substrate-binding protein [Opitutaceae bacterium]
MASVVVACACLSPLQAREARVVSQSAGTDELLIALATPGQIAALSHIASDAAFSAVAGEAKAYPHLDRNDDAEGILKHRPTLVLFADYSRIELVEQVRRAGIEVMIFDEYARLEDAFENLRRLAHAIGAGAAARAEAVIADCRARVSDLQLRLDGCAPARVIAPSTYGVIPGSETTFQDMCDHACAENLAATLGGLQGHAPPPVERMLTWPVDRVVLSGESIEDALAVFRELPPYSLMPAVREGRAVLIEPWQLSCVSHYRVRAYETLARALHPARFDR